MTAACAVTAVGLWPRGLQADGTGHGAYRQARRVVRAVSDHRTGYSWTFPGAACDPGQIKPAVLVACAVLVRIVVAIELAVPDGAGALRARSQWRRSGGAAPPLGHCVCDREVC